MQARKNVTGIKSSQEAGKFIDLAEMEHEFNRLKREQLFYRIVSLIIFLLSVLFIFLYSLKGLVLVTALGLSVVSFLLFSCVSGLPEKKESGYCFK